MNRHTVTFRYPRAQTKQGEFINWLRKEKFFTNWAAASNWARMETELVEADYGNRWPTQVLVDGVECRPEMISW